jgi:hypothetical protein
MLQGMAMLLNNIERQIKELLIQRVGGRTDSFTHGMALSVEARRIFEEGHYRIVDGQVELMF